MRGWNHQRDLQHRAANIIRNLAATATATRYCDRVDPPPTITIYGNGVTYTTSSGTIRRTHHNNPRD